MVMRDASTPERTVLVVEDDDSIVMGLEMNLSAEGYRVVVARDGEEGLARAREPDVDLVILDVMLPKLNGFEVLKSLRAQGANVPVLMLSARGGEMDKVMGLELGAELLARVRAVLHRDARARARAAAVRTAPCPPVLHASCAPPL